MSVGSELKRYAPEPDCKIDPVNVPPALGMKDEVAGIVRLSVFTPAMIARIPPFTLSGEQCSAMLMPFTVELASGVSDQSETLTVMGYLVVVLRGWTERRREGCGTRCLAPDHNRPWRCHWERVYPRLQIIQIQAASDDRRTAKLGILDRPEINQGRGYFLHLGGRVAVVRTYPAIVLRTPSVGLVRYHDQLPGLYLGFDVRLKRLLG